MPNHYPNRQPETAPRPVRRSPVHEHLKAAGAVFREMRAGSGANWVRGAAAGTGISLRIGYGQNWFENHFAPSTLRFVKA